MNIGGGDEVIVPSNTFIATALAVTYAGAELVLVEPDIRTFNLDPSLIESAISEKTKADFPIPGFELRIQNSPLWKSRI